MAYSEVVENFHRLFHAPFARLTDEVGFEELRHPGGETCFPFLVPASASPRATDAIGGLNLPD